MGTELGRVRVVSGVTEGEGIEQEGGFGASVAGRPGRDPTEVDRPSGRNEGCGRRTAPARSSRDSRSVCEGGNSGQVGIGGARGPSTRR